MEPHYDGGLGLGGGAEDLEGAEEVLVDGHHPGGVVELSAVVRGGEDGDEFPLWLVVISFVMSLILAMTCLYALFFLGCIFLSNVTRKQAFNVYLMFLVLPDAQLNAVCAIAKFYEEDDDTADPVALKKQLMSGWTGIKNPFSSSSEPTETTSLV